MRPYLSACRRECIAEGEDCFWIPCGGPRFELSGFGELVRTKRDNGEQPEQGWCRAQDRLVGPLALGFDAEMRTGFLKSDFDLPAAHEPGENVAWSRAEIGGEKGLRFEFAFGIADEHPADRQRRDAASIPNCGAAGDLDDAVGSAVPETDAVAFPGDLRIVEDGGKLFQALALDRGPAAAFVPLRREREQLGVEPQP